MPVLSRAYTELLPADKVDRVEELLKQKSERGMLAFVGDGINDAPVLARADLFQREILRQWQLLYHAGQK